MADGTDKPIEEVRVDDEVLSCYGSGIFRPARVTRVHRSERREGIAITTRSGRQDRVDAGAHPLRRLQAGVDPAVAHDVPDVEERLGLPCRYLAHVHRTVSASRLPGRRSGSTVSTPTPRGSSACMRTRRRRGCRDAPVAAVRPADVAFRRASLCGCPGKERRGRSGAARPALRRDRYERGRPEPSAKPRG